jgi:hypothetical protein
MLKGLLHAVSVSSGHLTRHSRTGHFEQWPGIVEDELRFHASPLDLPIPSATLHGKDEATCPGTRESLLTQGPDERSESQPVLSTQSYQHHAAKNKT